MHLNEILFSEHSVKYTNHGYMCTEMIILIPGRRSKFQENAGHHLYK